MEMGVSVCMVCVRVAVDCCVLVKPALLGCKLVFVACVVVCVAV